MHWWLDIFLLLLVMYVFYRLRQVEKEVYTIKTLNT